MSVVYSLERAGPEKEATLSVGVQLQFFPIRVQRGEALALKNELRDHTVVNLDADERTLVINVMARRGNVTCNAHRGHRKRFRYLCASDGVRTVHHAAPRACQFCYIEIEKKK